MFESVSWSKLQNRVPVNLGDVIEISNEIETDMDNWNNKLSEPRHIFNIRSKLNILMNNFTNLFYEEGIISEEPEPKKADKKVLAKLIDNISRMMARLDELEAKLSDKPLGVTNYVISMPYYAEMESILYNIYFILKKASQKPYKSKREFYYYVYESTVNSANIFGGEARMKGREGFGVRTQPTILAKEALSEEGQNKLIEEHDKDIEYFIKVNTKNAKTK